MVVYQKVLGIALKTEPQILQEEIGIPLFNALFTGQLFEYYQKVLNPASSTAGNLNF
jgi:hypothetical protein